MINTESKIVPFNQSETIEQNDFSKMKSMLEEIIVKNEETINRIDVVIDNLNDEAQTQRNYRIHLNQENARTTDFCKKALIVTGIASSYFVGAHFGVVPHIPLNF